VHDLHVWTITSGLDAMSGHLVVPGAGDAARVLRHARQILADEFKVDHVTIQIEDAALRTEEKALHI
ncbi:cation transporter, partial [Streptomyces purpurogeneiscleroticus]